MRLMMALAANDDFSHPIYWAPFTILAKPHHVAVGRVLLHTDLVEFLSLVDRIPFRHASIFMVGQYAVQSEDYRSRHFVLQSFGQIVALAIVVLALDGVLAKNASIPILIIGPTGNPMSDTLRINYSFGFFRATGRAKRGGGTIAHPTRNLECGKNVTLRQILARYVA